MKAIRKVPVTFGVPYFWIHGTLSEPVKGSMCVCERLKQCVTV